ncbi:hypothetical protein K440DRAFT_643289 [Wilcoxina mikolae CBS 423.85]|nr:hypothetical protein K440DRAFT_643289 [Wilcoxina mikolae CBS 423.85]
MPTNPGQHGGPLPTANHPAAQTNEPGYSSTTSTAAQVAPRSSSGIRTIPNAAAPPRTPAKVPATSLPTSDTYHASQGIHCRQRASRPIQHPRRLLLYCSPDVFPGDKRTFPAGPLHPNSWNPTNILGKTHDEVDQQRAVSADTRILQSLPGGSLS